MAEPVIPRKPRRYNVLTPSQRQEIIRRYLTGERDRDLAAEFGVSRSFPRNTTVNAGYAPRQRQRLKALREDAFAMITPESAYWIGFLMADGCVMHHRRGGRYVRVALAAEDATHIEAFRTFIGFDGKIHIGKRGPWNGYQRQDIHALSVGSARMAADLARYGVVPNKSKREQASDDLVFNRDFWRGVIDGDGSIFISNKNDPTISLCNGGASLLHQFSRYVQSMVQAKCTIHVNREGVHTVSISGGRIAPKIVAALYEGATIALDRKAAKAHAIMNSRLY